MCARYERAIAAKALEELIRTALAAGAEDVPPLAEVLPTNPALIVGNFGHGLQIMPARWGVDMMVQGKHIHAFNARVESLDKLAAWRHATPCWMPATGWFEWQDFAGRKTSWQKPKYRLGPTSGEPFLLRALATCKDGAWQCAFVMQDAPPHLAPIHNRAPFPYPLSVVRDPVAPSILNHCTASRLSPGRASPDILATTDERLALARSQLPT